MQRAIETTGTVDGQGHLHLTEPLAISAPASVRVIVLFPSEEDLDEQSWLRAAGRDPAFAFLQHPEEDVYSAADGAPFKDGPS